MNWAVFPSIVITKLSCCWFEATQVSVSSSGPQQRGASLSSQHAGQWPHFGIQLLGLGSVINSLLSDAENFSLNTERLFCFPSDINNLIIMSVCYTAMMILLRQTEINSLFDTYSTSKEFLSIREYRGKNYSAKFTLHFGPLNVFLQFLLS